MRTKLLRGDHDSILLLVYPATMDEHGRALTTLGRPNGPAGRGPDAGGEGHEPAYGAWVVTTAEQRDRWGLPDLAACGWVPVVDEREALGLLRDGAVGSAAVDEPPAAAEAASSAAGGRSAAAALEAVRALVTPGARVDQMVGALDGAGLPHPVCKSLRRALRRTLAPQARAVEEVLERAGMVLSLPWRTREPARFDPVHLKQALDRTHGGLEQVKKRLLEVLAACPQIRGPLTVEGPRVGAGAETERPALVVRPGPPRDQALVPCLAGARGTGKSSLAVAVAEALGRTHVRVPLGMPNAAPVIRGLAGCTAGRIIWGLRKAGVNNPVFILEAVDKVEQEAADAVLDVLDPERCTGFRDAYIDVPFDLSGVLWIVTATDPGAIPEPVRKRLEVIELAGYTEQEKLAIAEQYLLKKPFDEPGGTPAGCLAPELVAPPLTAAPDAAPDAPMVLLDQDLSSFWEGALSSGLPLPDTAEAWRTAACTGDVRFEPEAIRGVIRDHTNEAGVADLNAKLAAVCRQVAGRRPAPGSRGPEVVTPVVVRQVLGDGDALPPAVRGAIARERRRLGDSSGADAATTNDWIEWLEHLPWTRRAEAPIDLGQVRAALDAGHAGLEQAKACLIEYLAVRRRNPRGGAVLCFAGPPGVGKTSLAHCVAEALGRGFVKLSCGGLRDESDLRGHNRTWKDSQPGWIVRELRRVGSKDPVFVLDEIDKLGAAPAALLLEALDPAQHERFRDAFVELPFDLSEILFITTANEPTRIPPALRDRLEIIDLPGYTEAEKVAIAESHLIDTQNRAAGLTATPVRFTRGACRRIIRDYTNERGIRQLSRCLQAICRKAVLGLETGDASLVRDCITARQVRAFLGEPGAEPMNGLERLREQLDVPALPHAVRVRGREVLERLSAWATTDPDHARAREYLQCLLSLPWTARTEGRLDLGHARAILDAGHAAHGAVKERLLDYVAVRLAKPNAPSPLLCLLGPPGVGKTSLARLIAAALGRECAWVDCGALSGAAALHGVRSGSPGRVVEELRRVGVRNPVFVLDEIDRLDEAGGAAAALLEALDPAPGTTFRDRYLDLPFDLSEALFVATATGLGPVPAMLRERMRVIELPGYTAAEKRVIATAHLLPLQLALHGLPADQVRITDEAVEAVIRGYTRQPGVWDLAKTLGAMCAKVVRRRAEGHGRDEHDGNGDQKEPEEHKKRQHEKHEGNEHEGNEHDGNETPVEVTPEAVVEMLGAPAYPDGQVANRTGQPGVAVGLCRTGAGGGEVIFVEASRMAGSGALTLTGRLGEVMRESARTAMSWLRANAGRYGLDPAFHRDTDVHLHVHSAEVPKEGASAGVTMTAALVSAVTGRPVRGDLAMTGEITLAGQVLPVGGIKEKVLAAHRRGLARVILPRENQKQVDEDLGDDLRRAVEVHYVTRIDELLELGLQRTPAADDAAAATPVGRVS